MWRLFILHGASLLAADFTTQVAPVLTSRCLSCHGAKTQMAGLRLDSRETLLQVIQPGAAAASKLIARVEGHGGKTMPPVGERLSPAQIAALKAWIDNGAPWAGPARLGATADHWSFRPVERHPVPPGAHPVDHFVLARLASENIAPAPEAAKSTLIRRLSLDLTGLPPSPSQLAAFLADQQPGAYERLVDSLLASPHFGERWARPWLDLARYADSDGYEKDYVRPHAWRYRQWVIDALNNGMPFDRFTVEQIAGDLLPQSTVDQKVATGFHRNTLTNREGGVNLEQFRTEAIKDRAATVSTVWLGLTAGCAQCHDHKYDPISQKEFYQLYAFFDNADERNIDAPLPGEFGPYLAGLAEYRRQRTALLQQYGVPDLQPAWEEQIREARANPGKWTDRDHAYDAVQKYLDHSDEILDTPPARRTEKQADSLTDHFVINYHRIISKERWAELKFPELRRKLEALKRDFPGLTEAQTIAERPAALRRPSFVHLRGDYRKRGSAVQPGTPAFLPPLPPGESSRLALARWIVSPSNPLTARVTVNRIWQEYFGSGLVRTPEDFGTQGERPTHPELLDALAAQFIDSGWNVKALHRLIVTSATYRQSSHARPELAQRDPDNRLLARQNRLRLPAELIRDSALSVSGLLYPAIGGKSVRPPQPQGVAELAYSGSVKWNENTGQDRYRRGLYIFFQRTVPYPQLMNFDAPDANTAACKRERSNTPLQALNLLNDPVFVEAARALATRLLRETAPDASPAARIRHAFTLALARPPAPGELPPLEQYLHAQTEIFSQDPAAAAQWFPPALAGFSRAESAAWVGLASVLLNLDEFITKE
jgi:cytochrome c553